MSRIEEIKTRREKALADGSFFLRVPTWLTSGDGRDFCAAAPDDIEFLLEKLALAVEALELIMHANGSPEDEDYQTSTAREALEKLRGEK